MIRMWILLVICCFTAYFTTTPTGAYTIEECTALCNKNNGFILPAPRNLVPITQPYITHSGLKCNCPLHNGMFVPFLTAKGLNQTNFLKWHKRAPCLGRFWLGFYGIKAVFPKKRKSREPKTNTTTLAKNGKEAGKEIGNGPEKGEACDLEGTRELRKELEASPKGPPKKRTKRLKEKPRDGLSGPLNNQPKRDETAKDTKQKVSVQKV